MSYIFAHPLGSKFRHTRSFLYKKPAIRNWACDLRKIKKLTAWISRKIKKLAILTCICGFLQYFLPKIKKLSDYFSAKIKKLTGWSFDKFLIKKTACMAIYKILRLADVCHVTGILYPDQLVCVTWLEYCVLRDYNLQLYRQSFNTKLKICKNRKNPGTR